MEKWDIQFSSDSLLTRTEETLQAAIEKTRSGVVNFFIVEVDAVPIRTTIDLQKKIYLATHICGLGVGWGFAKIW